MESMKEETVKYLKEQIFRANYELCLISFWHFSRRRFLRKRIINMIRELSDLNA